MIRNAVIITDNGEESTVVTLGKTVTFKELPDGDEEAYTIVGSAEADPFEGRISNDSPIAKSLLGKQIGEKVAIQTPWRNASRDYLCKIIKITRVKASDFLFV